MYEMLTGKVPFTGDNPVSVALKHMQEKPSSLRVARRDIPLELELVVLRALEKQPANRFQSMEEMAEALLKVQAILDDQGAGISNYVEVGPSKHNEVYLAYLAQRDTEGEVALRRTSRKPVRIEYEPDDDHTRIMTSLEETRNQKFIDDDYYEKPERKVRKRNVLLLVIGAVLLFFLSFGGVQWLIGDSEVQVPSLINKSVLEAEDLLTSRSLKILIADEVYDNDVPAGRIISQKPVVDSKVKKNRQVEVVVSLGAKQTIVPDLTGKNQRELLIALENAELELGEIVPVTDSTQPYGYVVYQAPDPGTEVALGTAIDVMINQPPAASIPSVIGKPQVIAQEELLHAGFTIGGISGEESTQYVKGTVLRQNPEAGESAPEGTAVTLVISNGPGPEHTAQFELIIPMSGTIVVKLQDGKGLTEIYRQYCHAGERVQKSFVYYGAARLAITCNDQVILEKTYES